MNQRTDNEQLLADVLIPDADSGFSSALLTLTLRQARRRRRVRELRRYGGTLVALLVLTMFISSQLRRVGKPEPAGTPQPANYQLVISQCLATDQIVNTQPLAPNPSVTGLVAVLEIRTTAGGFREVGDDELMELAAPRIVALVRRGPHEAELVFVPGPSENPDSHPN